MKIIKIIIILCFILVPNVLADQLEQNAYSQVVQKEIDRGNRIVLDKIQAESDMCYKNIETTANSYFWSLREDFKTAFWFDRIITFIGMYVSFVLAFISSYYYQRRLEKKKDVLKLGRKEVVKSGGQ